MDAQTTAGLGFHYRGIKSAYVGGRLNYADRIPIRYNPEEIIQGFISREVIQDLFNNSFTTVDIYMGRYFDISDNMNGRISLSVNNVLNNEYVRWSGYSFDLVSPVYGFTRTYTVGLQLSF